MGTHKIAVGAFANRLDTELALQELKKSNFPMDKVSVIVRDADDESQIAGVEPEETTGNMTDEGAIAGAVTGGALGGITGLLVGLGTLAIPGVGPIMLAGAEATTLASAIAGSGIGAVTGGLVGALIGLGIPEEQAKVYNELVSQGCYLVTVDGTEEDIIHAQVIFSNRDIKEWGVYYSPVKSEVKNSTQGRKFLAHYKYAIGIFHLRQNISNAILELRDTGFSMDKVYVVVKDAVSYDTLKGLDMKSSIEDYPSMGLSDSVAESYHERVEKGDYLLVISGTDIEITAAKVILDKYQVEEFARYNPHKKERIGSSYQILSSNS
ncbi:MAG: hypothetical protein AAF378_05060 [Cyanobacteria bacterium P01_A01_bin.84]